MKIKSTDGREVEAKPGLRIKLVTPIRDGSDIGRYGGIRRVREADNLIDVEIGIGGSGGSRSAFFQVTPSEIRADE